MHDVTLYLIANPLIAIGVGLLALLTVYNVLRGQVRVAMGMWLTLMASLFYVWVQISAQDLPSDDELVQPPAEQAE
jgi:hypothetical protein